ncbi:MAG: winged helix-turn-helix transcriptional regulator [Lachnospiraceae bacterium]|nr:winged helix-turn-helix transcriptional regulator [Lachnospiraceae bacterium]
MDTEFETLLYGQQFKKLYEKMSNLITEKYGLHKVEIEILLFLKKGKGDTARDIAENKFFSKAHISHAIDHLMECGYLVGKLDGQDRRCVHLVLREEAEPVCEELLKMRENLMNTVCQGITEEERLMMRQVAKKIACNISKELM